MRTEEKVDEDGKLQGVFIHRTVSIIGRDKRRR